MTYYFSPSLAKSIFVLSFVNALLDILVMRNLVIVLMTVYKYCKGKRNGYIRLLDPKTLENYQISEDKVKIQNS
jgi:hypothetical protein